MTAVLFICILLPVLLWPVRLLTLTGVDTGEVYLRKRVVPGEEFSLSFRHSMYDTWQREVYEVDAGYRLMLKQVKFGSSQAADYYLWNAAPEERSRLRKEGDLWNLEIVDQRFDQIIFRAPLRTDMYLEVAGARWDLPDLVQPGEAVCMTIKQVTIVSSLRPSGLKGEYCD